MFFFPIMLHIFLGIILFGLGIVLTLSLLSFCFS